MTADPTMTLHAEEWGRGERVVLVHGSLSIGPETWAAQRPLADLGYGLVVPDRRGLGRSAALADAEDYVADAQDLVTLLGQGAHLVGHSYGALGALLVAAAQPHLVRSLVVVEPPAFALGAGDPLVDGLVRRSRTLWSRTELSDRDFLERFLADLGVPVHELPEEALQHWTSMTAPLRKGAVTWEAQVPIAALAAQRFPVVVVSGGPGTAFHVVCEALARGAGARLEVVTGGGHEAQSTGAPFNEVLLQTWHLRGGGTVSTPDRAAHHEDNITIPDWPAST